MDLHALLGSLALALGLSAVACGSSSNSNGGSPATGGAAGAATGGSGGVAGSASGGAAGSVTWSEPIGVQTDVSALSLVVTPQSRAVVGYMDAVGAKLHTYVADPGAELTEVALSDSINTLYAFQLKANSAGDVLLASHSPVAPEAWTRLLSKSASTWGAASSPSGEPWGIDGISARPDDTFLVVYRSGFPGDATLAINGLDGSWTEPTTLADVNITDVDASVSGSSTRVVGMDDESRPTLLVSDGSTWSTPIRGNALPAYSVVNGCAVSGTRVGCVAEDENDDVLVAFSSDGGAWTEWTSLPSVGSRPFLHATSGGEFVLTWTDTDASGGGTFRLARVTPTSTTPGASIEIAKVLDATLSGAGIGVHALEDGSVHVVVASSNVEGTAYSVRAFQLSSTDELSAPETVAAAEPAEPGLLYANIAANTHGTVVVAWGVQQFTSDTRLRMSVKN